MIDLMKGDCLDLMSAIPDGSVDMILCDLPYGITACKWDSVIPFEPLWAHYKRVIKPNGAIVLFGSQPFTSALVMSNPKWFKYCWIWEKSRFSNQMLAKKQPLKIHEDVAIFGSGCLSYYPQGVLSCDKTTKQGSKITENIGGGLRKIEYRQTQTNYPKSIQKFKNEGKTVHPTQKPVPLLEYLIKTYTNESETVLDNCMGSGSTGVAAVKINRSFIGIELDDGYFDIAKNRINEALALKAAA